MVDMLNRMYDRSMFQITSTTDVDVRHKESGLDMWTVNTVLDVVEHEWGEVLRKLAER